MRNEKLDIIIIRGAPGSGKTQTAKCLSEHFPDGVLIEVDTIRSMVISVDWTNQNEHINMLDISARLAHDFIKLGFGPVIIVDTFSSGKMKKYIEDLNHLNPSLSIRIFGLYTNDEELQRRIGARKQGEFRKYEICKRLNDELRNEKYDEEIQIDTTMLLPVDTANLILKNIQ